MATDSRSQLTRVAAALILTPLLFACPSTPYPEAKVDLAQQPSGPVAAKPAGPARLRFSVAAMLSPQGSLAAYSHLFELMGKRLGTEVEFVQRRTYREVNDLLASGQVDAAIICTGGFLELEKRGGKIEILAVPVVGDVSTYHSYVIVPAGSRAKTLADLAGKRFAYTDELSLSGRAYAIYWLKQHKADPATFFGSVQLTQSHDRSVEAVAKGVVDGAAVDSLIYEEMVKARPELAKAIRILDRSPAFGAPPVVVATSVAPDRREALRKTLLEIDRDAEGAHALAAIGFDRFDRATPALYDGARAVMGATW